ncbi:MAG: Holliday junction branch migration protein RuvA [Clostridia bacterium]|nr:Holliday junction branch migration protein RuvA [Clostridia bacterium]MBQ6937793.1 Holliday junction branch migration protein RuvA [Clostridia bacterium]
MISFLRGIIASKSENGAVIDVGGVGFFVNMPSSDIAKLGEVGENITVNTYFQIRDEEPQMYGFLTSDEMSYFNKLISISGIGPKAALAILGTLSVEDLAFAIISEDVKAITRAPGVGTKMAQRVILELKGKIDTQEAIGRGSSSAQNIPLGGVRADTGAVNALIALGASPSEAQKVVMQIDASAMSTEDIIKEALRRMSNGI